ncbi:MAG TPA: glycosyltransferase family 4 protein [bacterium]|nr:glycosyltransferase family 4 protein [bacterium]HQG45122.1 glycosyltransferase family 4 protein [bacterium]HQI49079.1 glycosyltransferase family 4 protein [bacterium]HQJ63280.1 glycosyltransferase family 4 protein [bacterium]
MPPRPAQLLFIQPSQAPFVLADADGLRRHFRLRMRRFHFKPFLRQAWDQWAQGFWLLRHLPGSAALFTWFADYHALVPVVAGRLFGKPVVIVVGGYDVARMPDYGYGAHLQAVRSFCSRMSLRYAALLLPVSKATADELAAFAPHAPSRILYNGVDTEFFDAETENMRERGVLTVCGARDRRAAAIKGIGLFLDVARELPQVPFVAVGLEGEALDWIRSRGVPENVRLLGRLERTALAALYARTPVYCQFSHHESFGMALAESMACGCVPVVTATGALPEVVGEAGWVVSERSAAPLAAAVGQALQAGSERRRAARQRIVTLFALCKRQSGLASLLLDLVQA